MGNFKLKKTNQLKCSANSSPSQPSLQLLQHLTHAKTSSAQISSDTGTLAPHMIHAKVIVILNAHQDNQHMGVLASHGATFRPEPVVVIPSNVTTTRSSWNICKLILTQVKNMTPILHQPLNKLSDSVFGLQKFELLILCYK